MTTKENIIDESGSAIICAHVATSKLPILLAIREEPLESDDSGWQFLCNAVENEDAENAQIWSIKEVLGYDPSLLKFINAPFGTRLIRENERVPWRIMVEN